MSDSSNVNLFPGGYIASPDEEEFYPLPSEVPTKEALSEEEELLKEIRSAGLEAEEIHRPPLMTAPKDQILQPPKKHDGRNEPHRRR